MKDKLWLILLLPFSLLYAQTQWLYVSKTDGTVLAFDRERQEPGFVYKPRLVGIQAIMPTPGGASVYLVSGGELEVFAAEDGAYQQTFSGDWRQITALQFSPKGERLFVYDGAVKKLFVYQHQRLSLQLLRSLELPGLTSNIVFNSRGSRYYAAAGTEIIIGDGYSGKVIKRFSAGIPVSVLAITGNDRYLWGSGAGRLVQLDERRARRLKELTVRGVGGLALGEGDTGVVITENGGSLVRFNSYRAGLEKPLAVEAGTRAVFLDKGFWLVYAGGIRYLDSGGKQAGFWPQAGLEAVAATGAIKKGQGFACF